MYEDFQDLFVKRLIKLRLAKGVSARAMSLDIGHNVNYIADMENKRFLPSMMIFSYICEYLKITPQEFFDYDIKDPAVYSEILNNLKKLDGEDITNVSNIIKSILK